MATEMSPQETVIREAQVGDLLEIQRGIYQHWAVYIGKNRHIYDNRDQFFLNLVHHLQTLTRGGSHTYPIVDSLCSSLIAKHQGFLCALSHHTRYLVLFWLLADTQ